MEVTAPKDAYYVGEQVPLTLRFGFDREYFRTNAVPLFPQRMHVPVHVQAELPGAVAPTRGPTFALNDGVAEAAQAEDEVRDGRAFTVLELEKVYLPSQPGDLSVKAPTLRYAHATRFEEDFVTGRVAKDPQDAQVQGAPLTLRILPLPEEGRPPEFQGAVGRFAVRAEADRKAVAEGEILRLTLTIEGEGNLASLPPPRLDALKGFHVYGMMDEGGRGGRTVKYDIAPLSADVTEIPAIPFAFFDRGPPPGYHVARTQPIPLEVRRREPAQSPPTTPTQPKDSPPTTAVVIAALLVAAVAALALWLRRRAPREAPADPNAARAREALAALHAHAARPGPDLADAFAEYLAAHLKCPAAAVIGPDLPASLVSAGLPPDLASRAAAMLERLVAARYSAATVAAGADANFVALLSELEVSFRTT